MIALLQRLPFFKRHQLTPSEKYLMAIYGCISIALFLYSFTQVDLGLTLTRWTLGANIQRSFQYIGYFNRPLSTVFYVTLMTGFFVLYLAVLRRIQRNLLSRKALWYIIILCVGILALSYNAFSYDLFNYIFDAKIATFYQQNPYLSKALDFPQDPMLGFMHWTQRTYPYGPVWLLLTIPLSFLGLQYFLGTLVLFKLFIISCYLASVYCLSKIMQKTDRENELYAMAFFALNPLVLIESVVSAHLDMVMMFFALLAFYAYLDKRYIRSMFLFLFSVGIKFATGLAAPVILWIIYQIYTKKRITNEQITIGIVICMSVAVIVATLRTNFQPWYLLEVFPFAALLSKRFSIQIGTFLLTVGALMQYIPFLYTGNWDPPIPLILNAIMLISLILAIGICMTRPSLRKMIQ